jgi:hypothetical protein
MNAPLRLGPAGLGDPSSALPALEPELARLDLLLEREILRLRARYELSLDEFRGLYISDRQVDELLRSRPSVEGAGAPQGLTAAAGAQLDAIEAAERDSDAPWLALARHLELSRAERDALLLGLAPELDPKYETLYAYLNNDVTRKWPTPELASRLFGDTPQRRVEIRSQLVPDARLLARGLLEPVPAARDLPRAQRGYRVAAPVADWLLGLPYRDERLAGVATLVAQAPVLDHLAPETAARVERAAQWVAQGASLPAFACSAPDPEDALLAAQQIFALVQLPALLVDLRAARKGSWQDIAAAVQCLCTITRVSVVAGPLDTLLDHEGRPAEAAELVRLLMGNARPLALAGSPQATRRVLHDGGSARGDVFELHFPEPSPTARAALWDRALGGRAGIGERDALADRFVLGAARIARATQLAEREAAFHGERTPDAQRLFDAARAVSAEAGEETTRTVTTPFDWDDLVVPPAVRDRLRDVLRAVELRPRVLDRWGFARRMTGARGVKVMFAGASGTGKTMAAAILAKSLALDLHRIELAAVVSKYIGETEKNLDRAFDAARRANAVLFIDEADALFGKRSEVKDAHDRYANVEIAYLLQKMEDHDGVVILATNLAGNIDEAFSRRMHYVVEFPMPDVARRERLWRGMFPADAPIAEDVDFLFLARQFPLSGGDIRNVVLDAAYRAAQADQAIGMRQIVQAVAQQYAKRGKLPGASEFREYFGLVGEPAATNHE